jgi:GTP-binding protein
LGEPLRLSAEHGEGMEDLLEVLMPLAEAFEARDAETTEEAPETDVDLGWSGEETEEDEEDAPEDWRPTEKRPLQIAVVGRPNAGKSTLINQIIGEDRLLTGPEAGITRDAISIPTTWEGTPVRIFDTAGMRKRAKVQDKLEKLSVSDGLRAVRFAEVVVVLLDVDTPFETQDLRIADLAEREGRAVVIAVNKWDLATEREGRLQALKEAFERLLPQLRGAPLVTVSARTGRGLDRLHDAIVRAHEVWNRRIPTAKLNRWLMGMTEAHPPPAPGGRRIKMRYMTQVKARPPAFVIMSTHPQEVPASYERYLVNGLRDALDLPGTPIRLFLRNAGAKNPYQGKKKTNITSLTKHLK